MIIIVELAGGGTTTGPEADKLEVELGTETEGSGYPIVCEDTVDWDAGYVTWSYDELVSVVTAWLAEELGTGYGTRVELGGGTG